MLPSLWQNYLLLWEKTNLTLWLKLAFTSLSCVPKWRFTGFVSWIWNNCLIKITWNKRLPERTRSARPEPPPQGPEGTPGLPPPHLLLPGDRAALGHRGRQGSGLGTGTGPGSGSGSGPGQDWDQDQDRDRDPSGSEPATPGIPLRASRAGRGSGLCSLPIGCSRWGRAGATIPE